MWHQEIEESRGVEKKDEKRHRTHLVFSFESERAFHFIFYISEKVFHFIRYGF